MPAPVSPELPIDHNVANTDETDDSIADTGEDEYIVELF